MKLDFFPFIYTNVYWSSHYLQEYAQNRSSGKGSFKRSNQPKLHAEGQRKRARKGSTSDYSKADFMKPPSGGGWVMSVWIRIIVSLGWQI